MHKAFRHDMLFTVKILPNVILYVSYTCIVLIIPYAYMYCEWRSINIGQIAGQNRLDKSYEIKGFGRLD